MQDGVGRVEERELLRGLLEEARQGRFRAVLLEGQPGIGKSYLLDWISNVATDAGVRILRGRGQELQGRRSFRVLLDAVGLTDQKMRKRSDTGSEQPFDALPVDELGSGLFRLAESLVQRLEEATVEATVLLGLDDLQWVDDSTLHILATLPERLSFSPLMLVGTMRRGPRRPEFDRLVLAISESNGHHVRLGPLSDVEVREFVERRVEANAGASLLKHAARAAGNPMLLREVLDSLEREGIIEFEEGVAEARHTQLPQDLRLTILRRISFLSSTTISVLRLASVLGSSFPPRTLAEVAGMSAAELLPAIDEAARMEVLVDAGDGLRFRHDLIREALYDDIPHAMRKALHRDIAVHLQAQGGSDSQVAEHFALGADQGDRDAISALRQAATNTLSPETRVSLLRQAFDLSTPLDVERNEIGVDLVRALVWGGRPGEAEELADELLVGVSDETAVGELWHNKLRSLFLRSRWQNVVELATSRLAELDSADPEAAVWLVHRALALAVQRDDAAAWRDGQAALALAEVAGSDLVRVLSLDALTLISELRFRRADSVRFGRKAAEIAAASSDPDVQRFHTDVWFAVTLTNANRLAEGLQLVKQGIRNRLNSGVVWDIPLYHWGIGQTYMDLGKWDDAIAEFEAALTSGQEIGTTIAESRIHLMFARIHLYRDRLEEAEHHLALMATRRSEIGPQFGDPRGLHATLIAARGNTDAGLAQMERILDEKAMVVSSSLLDWIPIIVDAGDSDLAKRAMAQAEDEVQEQRSREPDPRLTAARGFLEADSAATIAAIEHFDAIPHWQAAVAKELAARTLAGQGSKDEAKTLAAAALDNYENLGAEYLARRVSAAMRALGVRLMRRTTGRRPASGWEALTDAEVKVAELAAKGLTNVQIGERLFVTRHTVQTHLKHVFAKLGITSRVQLANEAARHRG